MNRFTRRPFLLAPAYLASPRLSPRGTGKTLVGLVPSSYSRLPKPLSFEHALDYERVRDMVWHAIGLGRPLAGSLEAKIKPGAWVVVKPNLVFLRPQPLYRTGDVTDLRVTRAVVEYLANKSGASRITIAKGGIYRGLRDPLDDNTVYQNDSRVNGATFDWGNSEFPGTGGSIARMLRDMQTAYPENAFDYIDLNYDVARDDAGAPPRIELPRTAGGVGAASAQSDYFVTRTILSCDFLISVPVMKVHRQCGITACLKNYVGTAPREIYGLPGEFASVRLHAEHSVDGRIDRFIADLASFHPPDFNVVDGIRGLQYDTHNAGQPDQMIRSNLVLAGEDPVAVDAVVTQLLGFNPWDIHFLHHGARRGIGTLDSISVDVVGAELNRHQRRWAKPESWYGRGNRQWLISDDLAAPTATWTRHTSPTDTLNLAPWIGKGAGKTVTAAVRVYADGHRKAFLWLGLRGRVTTMLNGQKVAEDENFTRYRVGQFQTPVELRPGENLLVFRPRAGLRGVPAERHPRRIAERWRHRRRYSMGCLNRLFRSEAGLHGYPSPGLRRSRSIAAR